MAVTLQSSRFGEIQVPDEAVLDFPSGLIGLGGRRFALLARSEESAFVWLHSMDDPELAVPVTNPWRFFEGYEVELGDDELWVHEVVGAEVHDRSGATLGHVVAVEANPAHDLLVLDGGTLVPMVFVVEQRDGVVVIDPPEGLLEL